MTSVGNDEFDPTQHDYYDALELDPAQGVTQRDIQRAFRQVAIRWHPDKNPGDEEAARKFRLARQAYDILCDSDARHAYDRVRDAQLARQRRQAQQSREQLELRRQLEAREAVARKRRKTRREGEGEGEGEGGLNSARGPWGRGEERPGDSGTASLAEETAARARLAAEMDRLRARQREHADKLVSLKELMRAEAAEKSRRRDGKGDEGAVVSERELAEVYQRPVGVSLDQYAAQVLGRVDQRASKASGVSETG